MICPKCGTENQDSSKFCLKCGTNLQLRSEKKKTKVNLPALIIAGILFIILIVAAVLMSGKTSTKKGIELPDSEDIFDEKDTIRQMQDSNDAQLIADEYVSAMREDESYSYYSIMDINYDGIPELIAAEDGMNTENEEYPSDANLINFADVYTFDYDTYSMVFAGIVGEDTPLCVGKDDEQLRSAKIDSDLIEYTYYTLDEIGEVVATTYTYDMEDGKLYAGEMEEMTEGTLLSSEESEMILSDWKDAYYIDFVENFTQQESVDSSDEDNEDDATEENVESDTESEEESDTDVYDDTEEESDSEDDVNPEEEEDISDDAFDYANCLDLDNYNYVETDYFSFYCPTDFYEDTYITDTYCGYSQDRPDGGTESVEFYAETYEEAGYSEETSPDEIAQQLIENFSDNVGSEELLLNHSTDEESDGNARVAISGKDFEDNNRYDAYTIDENYIYTMSICFRPSSSDEEANWENYYIDCLYRGCSFTRDVGEMDTYEDYLDRS